MIPTTSDNATIIQGCASAHQQQHHQERGTQHLDGLEQRDHATPVGPVGQDAAHQGQEPAGRVQRECIEPHPRRRSPRLRSSHGFGHLLRPRPDVGQQAGDPEGANRLVRSSDSDCRRVLASRSVAAMRRLSGERLQLPQEQALVLRNIGAPAAGKGQLHALLEIGEARGRDRRMRGAMNALLEIEIRE